MPSAVAPSLNTPFQALTDPSIRLRQTVRAVRKWHKIAEKYQFEIVVADNTGYGDQIRGALPSKYFKSGLLHIIDVPLLSEQDVERGKGAGETLTLIKALEFANVTNHSIVAKVNARYFTTNGIYLVNQLSEEFDFAAWPRPKLDSVDTTFFVGSGAFLSSIFQKVYADTNDIEQKFVENLYADYSIRDSKCRFERLSYIPAIKGQSGTTGSEASPFNEARLVSLLVRLREYLRKSLPFIRPKYQRK
jgi:hypothetical protein